MLLVVLTLSASSWYLLFSKSTRRKLSKPGSELYKLNEEQQNTFDAMNVVGLVIVALVSTIILFVMIVVAVTRLIGL